MSAAAFTLPHLLGSRATATALVSGAVRSGTSHVVINANDASSISPGAADAVVETLAKRGAERVVLFNANEHVTRWIRTAVEKAGVPFLLVDQHRDEALLLRQ